MSIANVTYVNRTRVGDGAQTDGFAWTPVGIQDFTGWSRGDISYSYTYEVYAGLSSWSDGSDYVAKSQRQMEGWRLRNALRNVQAEFLAVKAALESAVAEEIGGVAVVDPTPAWLDGPMESPPEPPKE